MFLLVRQGHCFNPHECSVPYVVKDIPGNSSEVSLENRVERLKSKLEGVRFVNYLDGDRVVCISVTGGLEKRVDLYASLELLDFEILSLFDSRVRNFYAIRELPFTIEKKQTPPSKDILRKQCIVDIKTPNQNGKVLVTTYQFTIAVKFTKKPDKDRMRLDVATKILVPMISRIEKLTTFSLQRVVEKFLEMYLGVFPAREALVLLKPFDQKEKKAYGDDIAAYSVQTLGKPLMKTFFGDTLEQKKNRWGIQDIDFSVGEKLKEGDVEVAPQRVRFVRQRA